jgi:DDE superfamily endonuclease
MTAQADIFATLDPGYKAFTEGDSRLIMFPTKKAPSADSGRTTTEHRRGMSITRTTRSGRIAVQNRRALSLQVRYIYSDLLNVFHPAGRCRRRVRLRRPGRHPHPHRAGGDRPALLLRQAPQARDEPAGHRHPGREHRVVSGPLPGAAHDLTAIRIRGILQSLAASGLITLADEGYHGAGEPVLTPYRGKNKPESQKQANRAHARLRSPGGRANAQLKTWRILRS